MPSGGSNQIGPTLHVARKTVRRDRHRHLTPTEPVIEREIVPPAWLKGIARDVFLERVAVYQQRGQGVCGFESTLAVYASVEADLIERWRRKRRPSVGLLAVYRQLAREFFDLPAASQTRGASVPTNRFLKNATRGESA